MSESGTDCFECETPLHGPYCPACNPEMANAGVLVEALKAADEALAMFAAFEDDARYIMGNTNFTIVQLRREQIKAALSKVSAQ